MGKYNCMRLKQIASMLFTGYDNIRASQIKDEDIRPCSVYKITLCYMSEEETWITIPADHPLIYLLGDLKIYSFSPNGDAVECWVDSEDWFKIAFIVKENTYSKTLHDCIDLLKQEGSDTKQQVLEKLEELVK